MLLQSKQGSDKFLCFWKQQFLKLKVGTEGDVKQGQEINDVRWIAQRIASSFLDIVLPVSPQNKSTMFRWHDI